MPKIIDLEVLECPRRVLEYRAVKYNFALFEENLCQKNEIFRAMSSCPGVNKSVDIPITFSDGQYLRTSSIGFPLKKQISGYK